MAASVKDWYRLDNAAMMFPAYSGGRNTHVFRFTCELTEDVDEDVLQQALDKTVAQNPDFVCTLRSGLFWHYLERSREKPTVKPERFTPCFPIYDVNKKHLLFFVSYYRRRIHVEFFHALTDGTGAVLFTRMLVTHYLLIAHAGELNGAVPEPDYPGSLFQRTEDSFNKNYSDRRGAQAARISMPRACQIRGKPTVDGRYSIVEAQLSAGEIKKLAHSYGTTVTGLLCAVFIRAIADGMGELEKRRPIVITVPFNLRNIFPSETQRNYFSTVQIAYNAANGGSVADIAALVTGRLKSEDTKRALLERVDALVSMQRNPLMRCAPLFMKDSAMRISKRINEKGETAVLSNVGRLELPQALHKYISLFSAASSTSNMHLCVLTFSDSMVFTFSSAFRDNEIARRFIRALTAEGIDVTVSTNYNQV